MDRSVVTFPNMNDRHAAHIAQTLANLQQTLLQLQQALTQINLSLQKIANEPK
jgi:HD-like signal output (HDOD) protein